MTAAPATAPDRAPLKLRRDDYFPNIAQRGDAVALLLSLPDACTPLVFFDPQFRALLDRQKYGNEGKSRQRRRPQLPAMTEEYIDKVCREIARVLEHQRLVSALTDGGIQMTDKTKVCVEFNQYSSKWDVGWKDEEYGFTPYPAPYRCV